ncbi:Coiled-coil domain-containing protein 124 homolog [Talaromyces islandicus]|uniref:Coiled-coil domain-containing protein 124 homolog n=1 Tax=Talaromyces islandicus TaxID=28573 RepID=A0A0U1M2M6_TALIS|nr:Coiled-coil domain-containing protein 124 homolog [Talaromyces islandicus]
MPKKAAGENSKKAAGNAKKAEAAAKKQAVADAKQAAEEDAHWAQGAKGSAKKDAAEAKKAEAARKKAEREALLKEEEASQPSKGKGAGAKSAQKKTRGLDLSQLDDSTPARSKAAALNASGIENALDALDLTSKGDSMKVDRHPERRFKAAYAAFEARRLPEIEAEHPGLRKQQRVEICKKEFEKSDENPFNKLNVAFDASREEIAAVKEAERKKVESRLASK